MLNLRKVFSNIFAHLFGQAVTVLATILIPWICLATWSAEDFGYWTIASACGQFLVIADLGVSHAISNHVCMDSTKSLNQIRKDFLQGLDLVVKRIAITLISATTVAFLCFKYLSIFPKEHSSTVYLTVFFLCLVASTQPLNNLYIGLQRAQGKNSYGIFITNIIRFLELLTLSTSIYLGADVLNAAIVALVARCFFSMLIVFPIIKMGFVKNEDDAYSGNIPPAVRRAGWGFAANFAALNISLHGFVLVASISGPILAASFAATRTAARIPGQPVGIAYASITPELTLLFSTGKYKNFWGVSLRMCYLATLFTIVVGFFIYYFSTWLELHWLHGKLVLDKPVLLMLILAMIFHVCWQSGSQVLAAINKTFRVGVIYFSLSITSILVAALVLPYFKLYGVALIWIFMEICMAIVVGINIIVLYREKS